MRVYMNKFTGRHTYENKLHTKTSRKLYEDNAERELSNAEVFYYSIKELSDSQVEEILINIEEIASDYITSKYMITMN